VSSAEDPRRASEEVEAAIAYILAGLREMAESGAPLPGPGARAVSEPVAPDRLTR
jgi:hypothetical protein